MKGRAMCLILPTLIIAVEDEQTEMEMNGEMRATVSLVLHPTAAVGQYALVDRRIVLGVIDERQRRNLERYSLHHLRLAGADAVSARGH